MPLPDEDIKKEEQVYENPDDRKKEIPVNHEKKAAVSENMEMQSGGKLLPFLNVKAELHQNRINNIDSKIALRQDKLARNEAKIQKLNEKSELLEDRNTMLRSTLGRIPAVQKLIEANEARIDRIRTEKIPERKEKCEAHKEKIGELGKQKLKITHKLNRVIALSETIKSFTFSHDFSRRALFVDSMTKLNQATRDCIQDKLSALEKRKAQLTEEYNSTPSMTEKINIQNKLNAADRRIMQLNERLDSIEEPRKLSEKAVDETMKAAEEKISEIENSEKEVSVPEITEELIKTVSDKEKSLEREERVTDKSAEKSQEETDDSVTDRKGISVFTEEIDFSSCSYEKLQAYRKSAKENAECAGAIAKALSDNYGTKSAWSLDTDGALSDVRKRFSDERIAFVLSSALNGSKDGRINTAVKEWAQNNMKKVSEMYSRKPVYLGGAHPGIINLFADRFIKTYSSEKSQGKENSAKYVNKEFYKSLPKEEREITSMSQPEAENKVAELQEKGIPVSAVLNGEKSAVTVAKSGYFSRNQLKREAKAVSREEKPKVQNRNKSKGYGIE